MESASSSDSEDCATGMFVNYGQYSDLDLKNHVMNVENLCVYVMYNELYLMDCFILPDDFDVREVKIQIQENNDPNDQNVIWFENTKSDKALFKLSDFCNNFNTRKMRFFLTSETTRSPLFIEYVYSNHSLRAASRKN